MTRARTEKPVEWDGSRVDSILADHFSTATDLVIRNATAAGLISLQSAWVRGDVMLSGSQLSPQGGQAICGDHLRVGGTLFLDGEDFHARPVRQLPHHPGADEPCATRDQDAHACALFFLYCLAGPWPAVARVRAVLSGAAWPGLMVLAAPAGVPRAALADASARGERILHARGNLSHYNPADAACQRAARVSAGRGTSAARPLPLRPRCECGRGACRRGSLLW